MSIIIDGYEFFQKSAILTHCATPETIDHGRTHMLCPLGTKGHYLEIENKTYVYIKNWISSNI